MRRQPATPPPLPPSSLLHLFSPPHAAVRSLAWHAHTRARTHSVHVLKMVSAQWLLHWGLNVLSYIGWSLPLDKRLFNTI